MPPTSHEAVRCPCPLESQTVPHVCYPGSCANSETLSVGGCCWRLDVSVLLESDQAPSWWSCFPSTKMVGLEQRRWRDPACVLTSGRPCPGRQGLGGPELARCPLPLRPESLPPRTSQPGPLQHPCRLLPLACAGRGRHRSGALAPGRGRRCSRRLAAFRERRQVSRAPLGT